ncbi:hypothetical protein [Micromonospora pallida]|uniref:hypothetical protein n=1 Tax=Micromonospora pallida TaxID=145854 RepID=UPI00114CE848|nr:hypothetical protein [Micromonospora pallida]
MPLLIFAVGAEGGRADDRQEQDCVRRLGFRPPAQELPADALELVGHRQFPGGQVDVLEAQAQHFTSAQPEDQDQHVCGVARVTLARADSRN